MITINGKPTGKYTKAQLVDVIVEQNEQTETYWLALQSFGKIARVQILLALITGGLWAYIGTWIGMVY